MLVKAKVAQAVELLKEFDIDCWITFLRESGINGDPILDYIVGTDVTWHSAFIITASGGTHAIVGQFDTQSILDTGAYQNVQGFVQGIKEQLQDCLRQINPRQIALNYSIGSEICDGLTHGMFLTLQGHLSEIGLADRIVSAEQVVSALRERKTVPEIKAIQAAIGHTEDIIKAVSGYIQPGRTELDIARFIHSQFEEKGLPPAWDIHTCPAVYTGPDITDPHYPPTDRVVEGGHVLSMDFGVKVNDYCSDMQRTFYVRRDGEDQVPAEVQHGFDTIVEAIDRSRRALKPGVIGLDIDKIARDHVVAGGYEEFAHGLGHQVGRFVHDGTALLGPAWEKYARKPFQKIYENMVFTIEPRLTVPDYGVVTIEEMVVVKADGAEFLSTPQQELIVI